MGDTIRKRRTDYTSLKINTANFNESDFWGKKQFQKAALSQEKLFRIIADFSSDWIYWVDSNKRIIFVSPACKIITGYEAEEMQNEAAFWKKIIHPHDLPKLEEHERSVLNWKSFCVEDFRIITKNGNTRWVEHMCEPVYDENDNYIGRYVCNKDITDLKTNSNIIFKKDNYIYRAFENSTIAHYQIYFDGRLKSANDYFIKLLGYNSVKDFEQLNFEDYCVINVEKRMNFKTSLLRNGHVNDFESEWIAKDGTLLFLRETAYAFENSDGSYTYYEGIAEDITEEKGFNSITTGPTSEKKNTEDLKREFLALISHEIRTPLNVILNFVNILKTDYLKISADDLNEYIGIIEKEGRRIQRTMGLLLEMAELQKGAYDFTAVEVDLVNDIFLQIYGNYQGEARQKNIDFSFINNLKESKIYGDKHGIYQIFNQLTDNAIKYTMPGGKVEIRLFSDEDKIITAEILDTGVGIKKEFIPFLFKAFSQEDLSYARMFEGTGLGLAVVRKHCELNGLSISVDSEKNKGAKFTIKFKSEFLD